MNERELEIRRRHELWVFHGAADSPGGQCHRDREWLLAELDRLRSEQAEMVKALRGLQEKWRNRCTPDTQQATIDRYAADAATERCADELAAALKCESAS